MSQIETIAMFSPSLVIGGAERAVVNLANGFLENGKAVHLLLANAQGALLSEVDPAVKIIDLGKKGVFGAIFPLARYLRDNKPDILLSVQSHANIIALLSRKLACVKTPIVINEQTTMSVHFYQEPGIKNRFVPTLARLFYRLADAVVCISQGVADDILEVTKIPGGRVHRIYNPILPVRTEFENKNKAPVEHPWLQGKSPPMILAVGRLTTAKDYPTLLRAFSQLRQKRNANLIILGEGEKRAALEGLVSELGLSECVSLPGFEENPYAYMTRASVFVLTSAWEGLSNVLVEALACGTPVVATDCKYGPAEILENGKYGILVPVGDEDAISNALLETIDLQHDRTILLQRSQDFSLETAVKKYLDLFGSILLNGEGENKTRLNA